MTRDPRYALNQEMEAKQTLLDQLRALAVDDPDFFTDLLEGETNLLELIAALDASIVDDETLVVSIFTPQSRDTPMGMPFARKALIGCTKNLLDPVVATGCSMKQYQSRKPYS